MYCLFSTFLNLEFLGEFFELVCIHRELGSALLPPSFHLIIIINDWSLSKRCLLYFPSGVQRVTDDCFLN